LTKKYEKRYIILKSKTYENGHTWHFFRAGGFDQVQLDSGRDLQELDKLDQKLWVALACPIDNVNFDAKTLSLIDTDRDRRIRVTELLSAVRWTVTNLYNPDDLITEDKPFFVSSINSGSEEGRLLRDAALNAALALGKKESDPLSIDEIEAVEEKLARNAFNGDGVITEDVSQDPEEQNVIKQIIASLGAVNDRSGKPGINAEKVEMFFEQAQKYNAWILESQNDNTIKPLGDETARAAAVIAVVKDKIEDYFSRCAIAIFDERSIAAMNGGEKVFENIINRDALSSVADEISRLPVAVIKPEKTLQISGNLNPAWADAIYRFKSGAVDKLLGPVDVISEDDWHQILEKISPWFSWQEKKPCSTFDSIDAVQILQSGIKEKLLKLIEQDKAQASVFDSLASLEKLMRFHRNIYSLCTNFVNFRDFYAKGGSAIFIAGTLYLDQRTCRLCIKIDDINKHSLMSAMAGTHLVYCECRRHNGTEKMNIVAAFTNGDSENLITGRNGIFYDRSGNDWDATIVKIIENPISLKQAFWLPYKSFVRMLETQVAKRATAAEAQSTAKLQQTAEDTVHADKNKPAAEAPKKIDIGVVAALGVAVGAIGTFFATAMGYAGGIIRLGPLAIAGAFIGVILLISGPSMVLAYIKLRKRNLGPILDASGWAVNAKALINVPFGTALTHIAALPPGAQRNLRDPYAEKKSPWPKVVIVALVLYAAYFALDHLGFVNDWTGGRIGLKKEHLSTLSAEKDPVEKKSIINKVSPVSKEE
jgi:hypothetical protein